MYLPAVIVVVFPYLLSKLSEYVPIYLSKDLTNENIALLTAHPDDEVMFFGPSLAHLVHPYNNNSVTVMCLSNGNADGIGHYRAQEFNHTLVEFFRMKEDNLILINDESKFPDSMNVTWDSVDIANALEEKLPKNVQKIVTFDDQGVSGHSNHISLYYGALEWQKSDPLNRELYILKSVPIWRKYIGTLDSFLGYMFDQPAAAFIVVKGRAARIVRKAMMDGYESQLAWFRFGWITFSRYMTVNSLQRVV